MLSGTAGWSANRRRALTWSLTTVVGQLLKAPVEVRRVRWSGLPVGRIVKVTLGYTDLAAAVYGGQLTRLVTGAVEQATGRAFTVQRHRERQRDVVLTERPLVVEEEQTSLEKARARVTDVVAETFGADATLTGIRTNEDLVTEFTVRYRTAAPRMTAAAGASSSL